MAALDDVITLPRLREAIGGVSDSNTELDPYRKAAISWLEKYTDRVIIDRTTLQRSTPDEFGYSIYPDIIWFGMSDIKPTATITLHYSTPSDDPSARPSTSETIDLADADRRNLLDFDGLVLYGDTDNLWRGKLRYDHPVPYIEVSANGQGMAATNIPAEWGQAVALIVRALYDGTAYDDLGSHSSLKMMLMPWRPTAPEAGPRRLR